MTKLVKLPVRLALRAEGDDWVAYIAMSDTMASAKRVGSIALVACEDNDEIKEGFKRLMTEVLAIFVKNVTGRDIAKTDEHAAPEHERAGNA